MAESDYVHSKEHDLIRDAANALFALEKHVEELIGCPSDSLRQARQGLTNTENFLRFQYKTGRLPKHG